MSDDKKECQATPAATLEQHVMDPRVTKSEAEWWASREIERLRAERDALKTAARNYLEVLGAAMAAGSFHMGGSRDMAHFVRAAMQQLDVLAFDRDEKRPTGLEKLHEEIVKGKERHQG